MTESHFQPLRSRRIPSLNIEVQEYRHPATGARHYHLASEDRNNAFLVAFLTVPEDSTGVAHILEHTVLCGSGKFPVRDPFFMMLRRTLSNFMNAMTSGDWTAYPFATRSPKDFDNLLQVYLDAVFFPRLDPLDFAQEGHRLEFERPDDPDSPLVYKGVVYNEMKGAMSSPVAVLYEALKAELFPTVTYHHNSGGDPAVIPQLTYEQLKAFHARHYHPSNAVFMTYGDMAPERHQARFQEWALQHFEAQAQTIALADERRYTAPRVREASYAYDEEGEPRGRSHVALGWLLGRTTDFQELMNMYLLGGVLLDHSGSPLRKALETTDLGRSPSELTGLDTTLREATLVAGLEGTDPEHAEAIEALVLETLQRVAMDGVPPEMVEAALHQVELAQREMGGNEPYGLQLMGRALPAALHGGDPMAMLDIDEALERLRQAARDPDYIKGLVRRMLLDNPHRVRVLLRPDPELSARQAAEEAERLESLRCGLDADVRQRIRELALSLKRRQEAEDDPEILPRVGREDIPADLDIPEPEDPGTRDLPASWYTAGTNGLVHEQALLALPALEEDELELLPILLQCLTEVGIGARDYEQVQAWQAVTGVLHAFPSVRADIEDLQRCRALVSVAGKGLQRNHQALGDLLRATLEEARFDELARLRELVSQIRFGVELGVTDHGHSLAMTAACAGMGAVAALVHRWNGLLGVKWTKALDDALEQPSELEVLAGRLAALRDKLLGARHSLLLVGEAGAKADVTAGLRRAWGAFRPGKVPPLSLAPVQQRITQGWVTSTQVNFCARAYPTVPSAHADAPAMAVLGKFLTHGYLHRAIREQGGAYGAGAAYDADCGGFRLFSYRDPRLGETLDDFDRAVEWLVTHEHRERQLEEAVLGVISMIDHPRSPAGNAIGAHFKRLQGRTPEYRRRFRARVLEVRLDDLRRLGREYLRSERASTAVLTNAKTLERYRSLELERVNL